VGLDSAGSLDFDPATRLRAEAAVLLAEGRIDDVKAKITAGLHALEHKSMSPGRNVCAEDAFQKLKDRPG